MNVQNTMMELRKVNDTQMRQQMRTIFNSWDNISLIAREIEIIRLKILGILLTNSEKVVIKLILSRFTCLLLLVIQREE